MKASPFQLNAGTGMGLGAILAALAGLVVQLTTGDSTIWGWVIPTGVAVGLAVGAGVQGMKGQHRGRGKQETR